MSSFFMKKWIGNEFDKVVKGFTGSDDQTEQDDISGEELVKEENRQAAEAKERKARQEKLEKEREEARQKIRDKYNIKKKDDPLPSTKKQEQGKVEDLITRVNNANAKLEKINGAEPQPQGFDPMKMTSDAFNSMKQKFGWK